MRFVPINCAREGMVLDKTIYGKGGQVLLREGSIIKAGYAEKIKEIGYNGIYIRDDLSRDIVIEGAISEDLKMKTIKGIKNIFISKHGKDNSLTEKNFEGLKALVTNMVDEILDTKNMMLNLVDLKVFDEYTFYHSVNVAVLSLVMGVALNLQKEDLFCLGLGALLHDIGKIFIDKEIVDKPGKLTDDEFEAMKKHSMIGYEYLKKNMDVPMRSYVAVIQHHEKYNGTGYPLRKKGEDIFLFSRIIALADVYDALTSDRCYRKALLPSEAVEFIMGNAGIAFDPNLVNIFVRKIAPYPLGTCVKLSNGVVGIVVENYEDSCMRPNIQLINIQTHEKINDYINLRNDANAINITIVEIVNI